MKIIQAYFTKNPSYSRNRSIKPIGVLVHSTGAVNSSLKRYVDCEEELGKNQYNNHWNKETATKSVHAFVGYDKNKNVVVAQTLPYDRACWGAGKGSKGSANYDPQAHIQFEICEGSAEDSDYYWKAIAVAEEYCAYLCQKFRWSVENITSHREAHAAGYANNHGDPHSYMKNFGDNMDKFRERVKARLNGENKPIAVPEAENRNNNTGNTKTPVNAEKTAKTISIELNTLCKGNQGKQVKTLQRLLMIETCDVGKAGADGDFGEKTECGVKEFQKKKGLEVDGIVGKNTWSALLK